MAKIRVLVSTKKPGLEFKVLKTEKIDDANVRATLVGSHGVAFDKVINNDILQQAGYVVQVREIDDANGAGAQA